jgi:hypothetical protein
MKQYNVQHNKSNKFQPEKISLKKIVNWAKILREKYNGTRSK